MSTVTESFTIPFDFPDLHADALCGIRLMRTLRIPDNGRRHFLPPGFGCFPSVEIDGGYAIPMHPIEAMWIDFSAGDYPMAVRVRTGLLDALTGRPAAHRLEHAPQNYCVLPDQPWLDGFKTEEGSVRQFVAVELGDGLSAEEQLIDGPALGGISSPSSR
jgi:hypothetical protein